MWAAFENPVPDIVSFLLKNGADVNAKDKDGMTALALAAANNPNPEIVSLLLENGADAHIKIENGLRAIDFAENNDKLKNTEALKQLQEASK
jgi:ankyrin repeat protein